MKSDTPKQYLSLFGKSVLRRAIEAFLGCEGLQSLRVIIDLKDADSYHDAVHGLDLHPFITGGKSRKESVYNGLQASDNVKPEEIILIHDAARPFTSTDEILQVVQATAKHKAATLVTPIADTLINHKTATRPDRDDLYALQTPQGFEYGIIKAAHENAAPDALHTDDSALVGKVEYIHGSRQNFKITTPEDWRMAETLIQAEYADTRTGMGFDVHAFDPDMTGPVRLCGIDVPHDYALKGHSDADVGLHTITDAILGAIGKGDIGQHFPPSNDTYKDMDSAIFLRKAVEILHTHGGILKNIDITLICERPKIGPHAPKMRQRIAQITGLALDRINVKATTTERLGFTGRGEGIAAQAVATIGVRV